MQRGGTDKICHSAADLGMRNFWRFGIDLERLHSWQWVEIGNTMEMSDDWGRKGWLSVRYDENASGGRCGS
ncbi:unnamed protein product [Linum trigynum]|uniref:Uncharacterized protein n=1 Tax=Linum trigynum TaxID=586398 RepID=A0AAV2E9D1_9ROSI